MLQDGRERRPFGRFAGDGGRQQMGLAARRGRLQRPVLAAAAQAGGEDAGLGAAPGPQQQWLVDGGAPLPGAGHRERAFRQEAAVHAQGAVVVAGEPVAPPAFGEHQQRPEDRDDEQREREHADGQPDRGAADAFLDVGGERQVPRPQPQLADDVPHRRDEHPRPGPRRHGQRREPDPGPPQHRQNL